VVGEGVRVIATGLSHVSAVARFSVQKKMEH
jgi:hypothetical protein